VDGSPSVFVNGRPAIRVDDPGIHAACCSANTWNAKTGSKSVLINGRAAHRLGDLVTHCGGIGTSIEGSPNVIVGSTAALRDSPPASRHSFDEHFILFDDRSGLPISDREYRIEVDDGRVISGFTCSLGKTQLVVGERPAGVKLYIGRQNKVLIR